FTYGNYAKRDAGSNADFMRVQLFTLPDAFYGYFYIAYPNGSLGDGVRNQDLNVDYSWNSTYSYESEIDDSHWRVLFRIPFKELRFQKREPHQWKVTLTRYSHNAKEYYSLPAYLLSEGKAYFTKAQDIVLERKINRSSDFRLYPYYVKSYDLISKTDSFDPEHVGIDISFNPDTRTKAKLSLNPDFSDVPLDGATDYYNSKYPPYLNENRYFFTEDIDAFGIGSTELYTRNIAQPRMAFKLTGTAKNLNYGYLAAIDKKIKADDVVVNQDDFYQVISLIPNSASYSFVNAVVSRMNRGYYNHLYSGSYKLEFVKDAFVKTNFLGTIKKRDGEDDKELRGYCSNLILRYDPRNWNTSLYATLVSKDFLPEAGYYTETDFTKYGYNVGYSSPIRDTYIRSWGVGSYSGFYEYERSEKSFHENYLDFYANLRLRSQINFNASTGMSTMVDNLYKSHSNYYVGLGNTLNHWESTVLSLYASSSKSLIYSLNDSRHHWYANMYFYHNMGGKITVTLSLNQSWYDYNKWNTVVTPSDTIRVFLDNNYQTINTTLRINPDTKTALSMGLGLSTYETRSRSAYMTYYT
ncbi:MAG: hypothetical protein U1C33_00960, partial [Candidatus Cloacimonadaceae bacterium]|nr:hypothetical protein [Candidatus Cloacimonadaceae bacterium]